MGMVAISSMSEHCFYKVPYVSRTLRYEKVLPVPAAHNIGKPFSLGMPFHVTSLIIVLGFNKLDENKVDNCMRLCFTKMHYRKHTQSTGVIL